MNTIVLYATATGAAAVAHAVLKRPDVVGSGWQQWAVVVGVVATVTGAAATILELQRQRLAEVLESLSVTKKLLSVERAGRTTAERLARKDVQENQAAHGYLSRLLHLLLHPPPPLLFSRLSFCLCSISSV